MTPWMVFAAAIDPGGIVEKLIVAGIVAVVASVITAYITSKILIERIKQLVETVAKITEALEKRDIELAVIHREMADLRNDRTACELRSSRSYATRPEFAQLVAEMAGNNRALIGEVRSVGDKFRESVSNTHRRIDEMQKAIAGLEATAGVRK